MQRAVNLPRLDGVDVHALFSRALGRPIVIRSDVALAGYSQWRCSAVAAGGVAASRFVYLTFGTGVGGVAIINSQIIDAVVGGPAQFGHLIVDTSADAPSCRCGARGCLEAIAGGTAIERTGVIDSVVRGVAIGLQQLSHLFAPDVICLGGGVIEHYPELVSRSAAVLRTMQGSLTPAGLVVAAGPLSSDQAGVVGAALVASQA
jgi:glucokinase